jgi:hypothetical protein
VNEIMGDIPLYYKYWGKARKKEDGAYKWASACGEGKCNA